MIEHFRKSLKKGKSEKKHKMIFWIIFDLHTFYDCTNNVGVSILRNDDVGLYYLIVLVYLKFQANDGEMSLTFIQMTLCLHVRF